MACFADLIERAHVPDEHFLFLSVDEEAGVGVVRHVPEHEALLGEGQEALLHHWHGHHSGVVHVDDAAHVGARCVDGGVQLETGYIDTVVGGAGIHYLALGEKEEMINSWVD